MLQATLVDTWASTAAGAFALSENNLYTTDAFHDYLSHLTDDGVVVFTRWGFEPPRESLRLISLAMEALNQLGENDPASHVIVGRAGGVQGWGAKDTVLISRKPLSAADVDRARALFAAAGMQAIYLPGREIRNQFYDLLHSSDPAEYERNYTFDISPVSRQPAVLLLHRPAPRSLDVPDERFPGKRRLQDQQSGAAAFRPDGREPARDGPDRHRAAARAGNAPARAKTASAASCSTFYSSAPATF